MLTPYVEDADFTLYCGDALEVLRELPDESVHCALTSPPFYALRDYGVEGQIGLEATPEEWCAALVSVFREVRRVLKPQGTLWIECGDSYCSGTGIDRYPTTTPGTDVPSSWSTRSQPQRIRPVGDLKAKDLLGTPWLLAFALRADGWWLRQCIVWHKPNGMPESATDRCTTNHSYVFLLSKQARYWFDADAIAEPAEWARWGDQTVPKYEGTNTASGWMKPKTKAELEAVQRAGDIRRGFRGEDDRSSIYVNRGNRETNGQRQRDSDMRGFDSRLERADGFKNARSVWTIPTRGFPDAHFATWPEALAERIIKAGCPKGGICLDPFLGSGTTSVVARRLGCKSIGIDLSAEYAEMAAERMRNWWKTPPQPPAPDESQLSLLAP